MFIDYIKMFGAGGLVMLLFLMSYSYLQTKGMAHLAKASRWLWSKLQAFILELWSIHCQVKRLKKLQAWRKEFNRLQLPPVRRKIRVIRTITFTGLLLFITIPAFAANNRYFRDGATGSTCTDWGANACD